MSDYNGWTNWETWNVNLWISNEEGLYRDAQEIAERWTERAEEGETLADGTVWQADTYRIARELREWFDELFAPDGSGPLSDAWMAYVQGANWEEIAEHLAEEIA